MKFRDFIKRVSLFALLQSGASEAKPYNPCADFGFEVVAGTPSPDTMRWLIGENHGYRTQTAKCIAALLQLEGEKTVFLEGYDHGPVLGKGCQELVSVDLVEKNIACYGWDDIALMKEGEAYYKDGAFYSNLFRVKMMHDEKKFPDAAWDSHYESMVSDKATFPPDVNPEKVKRYSAKLLAERKKGLTYDQIFEKVMKEASKMDNSPGMQAVMFKRDQSLVKALRANPKHKKAILVAGYAHLHQNTIFFADTPKARDYVKKEMRKDEKKASYAILKFNNILKFNK